MTPREISDQQFFNMVQAAGITNILSLAATEIPATSREARKTDRRRTTRAVCFIMATNQERQKKKIREVDPGVDPGVDCDHFIDWTTKFVYLLVNFWIAIFSPFFFFFFRGIPCRSAIICLVATLRSSFWSKLRGLKAWFLFLFTSQFQILTLTSNQSNTTLSS